MRYLLLSILAIDAFTICGCTSNGARAITSSFLSPIEASGQLSDPEMFAPQYREGARTVSVSIVAPEEYFASVYRLGKNFLVFHLRHQGHPADMLNSRG